MTPMKTGCNTAGHPCLATAVPRRCLFPGQPIRPVTFHTSQKVSFLNWNHRFSNASKTQQIDLILYPINNKRLNKHPKTLKKQEANQRALRRATSPSFSLDAPCHKPHPNPYSTPNTAHDPRHHSHPIPSTKQSRTEPRLWWNISHLNPTQQALPRDPLSHLIYQYIQSHFSQQIDPLN